MPDVSHFGDDISRLAATGEPVAFRVHGGPVDAGVPRGKGALSLPEAVRIAVVTSPEIQASLARVRIALTDAKQARLLPNPVLSIACRFPEGGGKPQVDVGLTGDLLSLLVKPRQIDAADARVRSACSEALAVTLEVIAEVQERFALVRELDARMAILEERQRILARLLDIAKSRVRAGEAGSLDATTFEAQSAALKTEILAAAAQQQGERLALARLIGEPSAPADWKLSEGDAPPALAGDEKTLVARAMALRPELQAQAWELAALGEEARVAPLLAFEGTQAGAEAQLDGDWAAGPAVAVPVPLFDWGQARREKTHWQLTEARHRLAQLQRKVVEEVRRSFAVLESSLKARNLASSSLLPLQEKRREQAEAAYRNGYADVTAILLAEQDLQDGRLKLIGLERDAAIAFFRLQRAIGGAAPAATTLPATQPHN